MRTSLQHSSIPMWTEAVSRRFINSITRDREMIIGIMQFQLRIAESHSLKEKRMVLKSIKDRLRQRFNVSVSEIGDQDLWQSALLGVASIGGDKRYVNGLLSDVESWLERNGHVELVSSRLELL